MKDKLLYSYTCFKQFITANFKMDVMLLSLFFTVQILFRFNPLEKTSTEVTSFSRKIGSGIANNYDVSKLIKNFELWFLIFAFSLIMIYLMIRYFSTKRISQNDIFAKKYLMTILPVAYANLLFTGITYFAKLQSDYTHFNSFSSNFLLIHIVCIFLFIALGLGDRISFSLFNGVSILCIGISIPITIIIFKTWEFGLNLLYSYLVLMAIFIIFEFLLKIKQLNRPLVKEKNIYLLIIAASCCPLITSLFIELVNILNQYNIYVHYPYKYYTIGIILFFVVSYCIIVLFYKKIKDPLSILWKNHAYPLLILGVGFMSVQLPLTFAGSYDIMESSNFSVLISNFLLYGKIPIIEAYGGHQLTSVIGGILYGIVNQDPIGSSFSPYAIYMTPILMVLFFFVLKFLLNEDFAVWATLIVPFYSNWYYFGLGAMIVLALRKYLLKKNYLNAFLIWIGCAICVFYRLDLGYAFGLAIVLTLFVYILTQKDWKSIKTLGSTFAITIAVGAIGWIILCLIKKIDPIARLKEFVALSLSNQVWSYSSIGDTTKAVFSWAYIFLPIICICILLYSILNQSFKKRLGILKWCILLTFGFAYLANFARGLTRHSMAELATTVAFFSAYFFISVFVACYFDKGAGFIAAFSLLVIINSLLISNTAFTETAFLDQAVNNENGNINSWKQLDTSGRTYWQEINEKVVRVTWPDDLTNSTAPLKEICDLLLTDDETFADFINEDFLYSVIGRRFPVYMSQSPLMVSGDFTQEAFIDEISQSCPLVLMPSTEATLHRIQTDGIANPTRYYKIAEYIYQNYKPLIAFGDKAIWCDKDKYDQYLSIIKVHFPETSLLISQNVAEQWQTSNTIVSYKDGSIIIKATGNNPYVYNIQKMIDFNTVESNTNFVLEIKYKSSKDGTAQLFYTTDENESFSEGKSSVFNTATEGVADFRIHLTSNSKLRLDIPNECDFTIESITLIPQIVNTINYGYDAPMLNQNNIFVYFAYIHDYPLGQIAYLWGTYDEDKAYLNPSVTKLSQAGLGVWKFNAIAPNDKAKGNYLSLKCNYLPSVEKIDEYKKKEEKICTLTVKVGEYDGGTFQEKYRYTLAINEGSCQYLIRISSDYFWYSNNINAIVLEGDDIVHIDFSNLNILSGD